jgi:site-specific DNA-cytosine methylase
MLQVALQKAHIEIEAYYSSEIDKDAIAVSSYNFPNHIRLGDLTKITNEQLDAIKPIDLVVFGSPCKSLSIANSNRSTGKDGVITGESAIFYDCLRILKYLNPKYFIMENVSSATKECKQIISDLMGVQGREFCASLVSPQRRRRVFWSNILWDLPKTASKSILKDILVNDEIPSKYYLSAGQMEKVRWIEGKTQVANIGEKTSQANRIYSPDAKAVTLGASGGGLGAKTGLYNISKIRKLIPIECERLMGLPDNFTLKGNYEGKIKEIKDNNRYKICGNGFHTEVIAHILRSIQ